jgi:hypothetical protein
MRPALHGAAVEPEQALRLLAGLERVRAARMDYMAQRNVTEWSPGCGLDYLDVALEEMSDVLELLKAAAPGMAGKPFDVKAWLTNVRAGRSAGMCWNASNQSGNYKSFPPEARGSFHPFTFGLTDDNDVAPALSDRQRAAGCRPTLWKDEQPGTAYADHPGAAPGTFAVPVRFFDWGQSGRLMAEYAARYRSADRPLDEVSAEALADEPSLPASYAYPDRPARSVRTERAPELPPGVTRLPVPDGHPQDARAADAEAALWNLLLKLYAGGHEVVGAREVESDPGFKSGVGRSRGWIYTALDGMALLGRTEPLEGGNRKLWRIIPPSAARDEA